MQEADCNLCIKFHARKPQDERNFRNCRNFREVCEECPNVHDCIDLGGPTRCTQVNCTNFED
jgi:hypothetical protein